jgi:hypothetical protein
MAQYAMYAPPANYLDGVNKNNDLNFRTNYLWPYLCYENACQ